MTTSPDRLPLDELFHAYGRAVDTPAHLAALADGEDASRAGAMKHLWGAILHQGTPCTATAPVARRVAELLGDPRLAGPRLAPLRAELLAFLAGVGEAVLVPSSDSEREAMRRANRPGFHAEFQEKYAELLEEAADDDDDEDEDDEDEPDEEELELRAFEAIWGDPDVADAMHARAFVGCAVVAPTLLAAALEALGDPDPAVAAAAAKAAGALVEAIRVGPSVGAIAQADADRIGADAAARLG